MPASIGFRRGATPLGAHQTPVFPNFICVKLTRLADRARLQSAGVTSVLHSRDERRPLEADALGNIVQRFTTHRFGKTTNPFARSERLTISTLTWASVRFMAARNSGP
jgi:hypothetical protein